MLAERIGGWFDEVERKGLQQGLEKGLKKGREEGREKGREEGREEGLQTGERMALRRLLAKRFGPLPSDIEARIEQGSRQQVEAWLDRVIDAPSLRNIFGDEK